MAAHLAPGVDGVHDGFQTSRWLIDGEVAGQAGNYHPTSIPTGVYKARDGYMNIAVFGSKIWERFCETLGAREWITDDRFRDKSRRSVNRDALNAAINQQLAREDCAYWIEHFNAGGVACGHINNLQEVFEERRSSICTWCRMSCRAPRRKRLVGQPMHSNARRAASRAPRRAAVNTPKRYSASLALVLTISSA